MKEHILNALLADGWREYPNVIKDDWARSFYKRFNTPTRCSTNGDKEGMQIELSVTNNSQRVVMEIELCGGLQDETWLKIQNYALPKTVSEVTALIPRLLAMWEQANKKG